MSSVERQILKAISVKIRDCYCYWKREVELAPWDSHHHHHHLCPRPIDKHRDGAQSYTLNAQSPSGNRYDMGNPICRHGQHYYFQHAHPLFTGYRNSWQKAAISSLPSCPCPLPRLQESLLWLTSHCKQSVLMKKKPCY